MLATQTRDQIAHQEKLTPKVLFRKLSTVLRSPRKGMRHLWARYQGYRAYKYLKSCLDDVTDLINIDPEAIGAEWPDLAHLYLQVRGRRLSRVVEFGSGQSTPVIISALLRNQEEFGLKPRLISFERDRHWFETSCKMLPANCPSWAEVKLIDNESIDIDRHQGSLHPAIPKNFGQPDLLYIDDDFSVLRDLPCINPSSIPAAMAPNSVIVIDGRARTVDKLVEELPSGAQITANNLHFYTEIIYSKNKIFRNPEIDPHRFSGPKKWAKILRKR